MPEATLDRVARRDLDIEHHRRVPLVHEPQDLVEQIAARARHDLHLDRAHQPRMQRLELFLGPQRGVEHLFDLGKQNLSGSRQLERALSALHKRLPQGFLQPL